VLQLVAKQGLVKANRLGMDASTMEANAALILVVASNDGFALVMVVADDPALIKRALQQWAAKLLPGHGTRLTHSRGRKIAAM
jgi:hypothetical protein